MSGWTAEVEVHGNDEIIHRINGVEVLRYQHPQLDPTDESAQALLAAGAPLQLSFGHIALQADSQPVWFRNIRIRQLEPSANRSRSPARSEELLNCWLEPRSGGHCSRRRGALRPGFALRVPRGLPFAHAAWRYERPAVATGAAAGRELVDQPGYSRGPPAGTRSRARAGSAAEIRRACACSSPRRPAQSTAATASGASFRTSQQQRAVEEGESGRWQRGAQGHRGRHQHRRGDPERR